MHSLRYATCGKFTINVSLTARMVKYITFYTDFKENRLTGNVVFYLTKLPSFVALYRDRRQSIPESLYRPLSIHHGWASVCRCKRRYKLLTSACRFYCVTRGDISMYIFKKKFSLSAKICFSHQWKHKSTGTNIAFLQKLCCISLLVCLNHKIDNCTGTLDGIRPGIFIDQ